MTLSSSSLRRLFSLFASLVVLLSLTASASAAGRSEWKSKTLRERSDKSWWLEVAIYLPRAPDVGVLQMKFEFTQTVYFERDMMDGDKIVERKVPMSNRQALIENVDVGFLDSGSGKIEPRTRFTFKVTRAQGYEAGEYKVAIRDTRNGQIVGGTTVLTFNGENELIDRRAMVFEGNKKKGDAKSDEQAAAKDRAQGKSDEEKPAAAESESEPTASEAPSEPAPATASESSQATIKEKPGGCGCRVPSGNASGGPGAPSLALLGALLARRRLAKGSRKRN